MYHGIPRDPYHYFGTISAALTARRMGLVPAMALDLRNISIRVFRMVVDNWTGKASAEHLDYVSCLICPPDPATLPRRRMQHDLDDPVWKSP